ncbi:MAG: family N-acetyltransferase [Ramlibacter sp.]|nr:family N-acetyltransferase [Ramlibacter sp.]
MEIRSLTPADATAYRSLRLRGLREHPEAFTSSYEEDVQQPLQVAELRLASQRTSFWGAFQGRELCGAVGLEREGRAKVLHRAKVIGMYVVPEATGQGVGAQLLQALLARSRAEGLESLVLTVTEGNEAARRLYERCGFRSFGIEPRAIKVGPACYAKNHMVLDLTSS